MSFRAIVDSTFRPQPSVVEFAESSDFWNKLLVPHQRVFLKLIFLEEMEGWEEDILTSWIKGGRHGEVLISPAIRERRDICRDRGYDHFSEIDLVGGRRSSKGYMTGIAGGHKLNMVHRIENIGEFYQLDPDKVIDFACIAASFEQAKTRQFDDLRAVLLSCKALDDYRGKDLETILSVKTPQDEEILDQMRKDGKKVARDFAKLRVQPVAANADTLRGMACIFLVFDEMAFFIPGESRQSAQACYSAAEPSLAQFGYHALVFCNSSPWTTVGQFFDQAELALRPEHGPKDKPWNPARLAFQFPSWAIFDEWWKDPAKRFRRPLMASPDWPDQLDPDIPQSALDDFAKLQREDEKLKEQANPDTYKVERRAQWATVLDAYLDPVNIDKAFSGILPDGQRHFMTNSNNYMYEYKAHCDPSSTTAGFGFALAHVEEFPDPTGMFPDGVARHVVFDRVLRWNPKDFPGGTINYLQVRKEIAHFIKVFYPTEVTFDQYNSVGLIQELRADVHMMNIDQCRVGKIDATQKLNWNRWEAFKTALNLGLVHVPNDCIDWSDTEKTKLHFDHSEYAKQELRHLQEISTGQTKRVEKQDMGPIQTKDVADCICEVTYKFLSSYLGNLGVKNLAEAHVQTGAEGGYQIGGRQPGGPMAGMGANQSPKEYNPDDYWKRGGQGHGTTATRGISGRRRRGY